MTEEEQINKYGLTTLELSYMESAAKRFATLAKDRGWDDGMPDKGSKEDKMHRAMDIALMHSELSEALEGVRKGKPDDHIPQFSAEAAELADTVIRIFHYAIKHNVPMFAAMREKHLYNITRPDHSRENRAKEGGKAF